MLATSACAALSTKRRIAADTTILPKQPNIFIQTPAATKEPDVQVAKRCGRSWAIQAGNMSHLRYYSRAAAMWLIWPVLANFVLKFLNTNFVGKSLNCEESASQSSEANSRRRRLFLNVLRMRLRLLLPAPSALRLAMILHQVEAVVSICQANTPFFEAPGLRELDWGHC
jgi:hypothetical protein